MMTLMNVDVEMCCEDWLLGGALLCELKEGRLKVGGRGTYGRAGCARVMELLPAFFSVFFLA